MRATCTIRFILYEIPHDAIFYVLLLPPF